MVRQRSRASSGGLYSPAGERKYLNDRERKALLAVLAHHAPERALFAAVMIWTGARISEVLSLSASSFQIQAGVVALVTLKRRRPVIREIPLPADLLVALDAHFDVQGRQYDHGLHDAPLWTMSRTTAWRTIKQMMSEAGIGGAPACPRGLRHAFGVGALHSGVPITLVQRWLGHARLTTTAIYADVSGPEERAFASQFWNRTRKGSASHVTN